MKTKTFIPASKFSSFVRWAVARCPFCQKPVHDWLPVAVAPPDPKQMRKYKQRQLAYNLN